MDKYTYKERDRALFVEKVGFISYHKKTDMLILFKYYKSLYLPKKEAKAKVIEILKKSSSDFDIDDYKEVLDRTANMVYSKNKKLIQIDKIQIYQEELDFITGLDVKYIAKKLLFAFLCFKKIEYQMTDGACNMNYYVEKNYKTKNLRKMFGSTMDIDMLIYELSQHDLAKNAYNTDTRLMFMDMIGETKELAFEISRFEDVALFFDRYNGVGKIKECVECRKLIKIKNKYSPSKYCEECAKAKELEKYKRYNSKR